MEQKITKKYIYKICVALIFLLMLWFEGCMKNASSSSVLTGTPICTPSPTCTPKPVLKEEQWSYLKQDIVLSKEQMEEFTKVLRVEVEYPYSEYFGLEQAFALYETTENTEMRSNNIIKDNVVDDELLYAQVIKNNAVFFEENTNNNNTECSDEEIRIYCVMISEILNRKLAELQVDTNVLDYILSNLKIVNTESFMVYASVTDDYCLTISPEIIASDKDERALEKTITHECMHFLQIGMGKKVYGICYEFEELNVNPLYPLWFVEASAEWAAREITGEYQFYQRERNYMETLAVAMFMDEKKLENYNFSSDLYAFYENLACNGLISKEEIATMMYAVEISIRENDEFAEIYKERTGTYFTGNTKRTVKRQYADGAHVTMAKKFYYDLCRQAYMLEDIFALMALFEMVSLDNIRYWDLEYRETPMTFVKEYMAIQDAYMGVLAECLGAEKTDIWNLYNMYFEQHNIKIDCTKQNERMNQMVAENQSMNRLTLNVFYRENAEQ